MSATAPAGSESEAVAVPAAPGDVPSPEDLLKGTPVSVSTVTVTAQQTLSKPKHKHGVSADFSALEAGKRTASSHQV